MLQNCPPSYGYSFDRLPASFTNTALQSSSTPSLEDKFSASMSGLVMSAFSPTVLPGLLTPPQQPLHNSHTNAFGLPLAAVQQANLPWTLGRHLALQYAAATSPLYYSTTGPQAGGGGVTSSTTAPLDPTIATWLQMRHQLVSLYYQQQHQQHSQQIQMQWNRRMKEASELVDLSAEMQSTGSEWIDGKYINRKPRDQVTISPTDEEKQEIEFKSRLNTSPIKDQHCSPDHLVKHAAESESDSKHGAGSLLQVICEPCEEVSIDDPPSPPTSPLTSPRSKHSHNTSFVSDGFDCKAEQVSLESHSPSKRRKSGFQSGITVGYTYDAFFVSDGRSKKKPSSLVETIAKTVLVASPKVRKEVRPIKQQPLRIPRQRYVCSECGKDYATSSNLSRHKQTHRSFDSQMAKKCPHCDKVYVSMPALSMHILTHDLKHRCNVCGKAFSRPWLLHGHLRAHTGEKPYGCAHCGRAFADRSNLRAHMQTHSVLKQYTCKRCGKSFALKSYLNKHAESACLHQAKDLISSNCPLSSPMDTSTCSSDTSKEDDTFTANISISKVDSCYDN